MRFRTFRLLVCLALGLLIPTIVNPVRAQASRIQYNETVQSDLAQDENEEEWEFSGHAGDLILIDMRADGSTLDTYLTLLDPFGVPLTSDDDSGEGLNSRIGPYRLPSDGIYTIMAARYGGTGSYLLELKNLDTIAVLSPGKQLVGVLDSRHTTDYFLLAPSASETLWRLSVSDDQSNTDPFLALYGTSGLLISTEYDGGSSIDPIVPSPDESYIVVVSWNFGGSGGPYQLDLNVSDVELLNASASQTGTLDGQTLQQRLYFRGEEGQSIRLSAAIEGDIILSLNVMTQDRIITLFSNTGDAPRALDVTLDITQTAVYMVEIWDGSYSGNSGTYTISLENLP